MQIVALVFAAIGLAALVAAVVTGYPVIAWVCVGAGTIGLTLLIVAALLARQQRNAQLAGSGDVLPFDADYPDDRPAADAPTHSGDKEVQREIIREERVLHSDTGPGNPDITRDEVAEAISHRRHR